MTGQLPPIRRADATVHGRQLRSNYLHHVHWTPLDFSDLLSLLWRCDKVGIAGEQELSTYYRGAWEALIVGLEIDRTELGQWLMNAPTPVMPAIPAFVERQAPFSEDLLARAELVTHLFLVRESLLTFGGDDTVQWGRPELAANLQSLTMRQAVNDLFREKLPAQIDKLAELFISVDELLYMMLIPWHMYKNQTLQNLITYYGFPDPEAYIDRLGG